MVWLLYRNFTLVGWSVQNGLKPAQFMQFLISDNSYNNQIKTQFTNFEFWILNKISKGGNRILSWVLDQYWNIIGLPSILWIEFISGGMQEGEIWNILQFARSSANRKQKSGRWNMKYSVICKVKCKQKTEIRRHRSENRKRRGEIQSILQFAQKGVNRKLK